MIDSTSAAELMNDSVCKTEMAACLNDVADICHRIALDHGFWQDSQNFGEKIALIHTELSECLEAMRHGDGPDEHLPHHRNAEIELADAVIRIFDLAAHEHMDIGSAIIEKMRFNMSRPFKHGKQF